MRRAYCVNVRLNIPYLVVITSFKEVVWGLPSIGVDRLLHAVQNTAYGLFEFFKCKFVNKPITWTVIIISEQISKLMKNSSILARTPPLPLLCKILTVQCVSPLRLSVLIDTSKLLIPTTNCKNLFICICSLLLACSLTYVPHYWNCSVS